MNPHSEAASAATHAVHFIPSSSHRGQDLGILYRYVATINGMVLYSLRIEAIRTRASSVTAAAKKAPVDRTQQHVEPPAENNCVWNCFRRGPGVTSVPSVVSVIMHTNWFEQGLPKVIACRTVRKMFFRTVQTPVNRDLSGRNSGSESI